MSKSRPKTERVNLSEKFLLFKDYWSPKIVGELNDSYIKVAKAKGEFEWHRHKNEDELFLVTKGKLTVKLRNKDINLKAGEFFVVPKGIEHKPVARREVHVVMIEPKTTLNTGDRLTARSVTKLERI